MKKHNYNFKLDDVMNLQTLADIEVNNTENTVSYSFTDVVEANKFYQESLTSGKDARLIQPNNPILLGYWQVKVYNN